MYGNTNSVVSHATQMELLPVCQLNWIDRLWFECNPLNSKHYFFLLWNMPDQVLVAICSELTYIHQATNATSCFITLILFSKETGV